MVLILLGAKMLLLTRAPTWHHCKSEVAITAGEYWWEKTLCSQQHIVRHAGKNKNLLYYWQRLCLHVYIKSKRHALCFANHQHLFSWHSLPAACTSHIMSNLYFYFLDLIRLWSELTPCQVMRLQSRSSLLPDPFHILTMMDIEMTSCFYRWREFKLVVYTVKF